MAEGRTYRCDGCSASFEAWSDGNPYYVVEGVKRYAYHPDHEALARCVGNDDPHVCLACAEEFMVDSNAPIARCPRCASADIAATWDLDGRRCPACRVGHFHEVPGARSIS